MLQVAIDMQLSLLAPLAVVVFLLHPKVPNACTLQLLTCTVEIFLSSFVGWHRCSLYTVVCVDCCWRPDDRFS
jgi:hypothetical protein